MSRFNVDCLAGRFRVEIEPRQQGYAVFYRDRDDPRAGRKRLFPVGQPHPELWPTDEAARASVKSFFR